MKLICNSYIGKADGFFFGEVAEGKQGFKFTLGGKVVAQLILPEGQFDTIKTKIFDDAAELDLTEIQKTFLEPDDPTPYRLMSPLHTDTKRLATEAKAAETKAGNGSEVKG